MLEFDLLVHGLVIHFVGLDGSFRDVYVRPRTLNKHILVVGTVTYQQPRIFGTQAACSPRR